MKSPLVKVIVCTVALIVLLPACAGPAKPVYDNLTQPGAYDAVADNISAAAAAPSTGVSVAQMLSAGDYDRAIEAGRAALTASPQDGNLKEKLADAYIARAWYYKVKRLNTYTLSDLLRAVEIAPKYYRAHYELGRFHNNQWQFSIGLFDLNMALSLKSDFAPAYSERGYSNYKSRKYEAALADVNKAIELDDTLPRSYCVRSLIYAATGKPDLALEDADHAVRLAPGDAASYYNRSLVNTARGEAAPAVADLETTLRLSQDDLLTTRAGADLRALRPK